MKKTPNKDHLEKNNFPPTPSNVKSPSSMLSNLPTTNKPSSSTQSSFKCIRCEKGPSYKKGHHPLCRFSQGRKVNNEKISEEEKKKRKSNFFLPTVAKVAKVSPPSQPSSLKPSSSPMPTPHLHLNHHQQSQLVNLRHLLYYQLNSYALLLIC